MFAFDESTRIRHTGSELTKFCTMDLAPKTVARRIATGLVTPRDPMDLYSQFNFLDWRIIGQRSKWTYRARYAITRQMEARGRRFKVIVGFRNTEELQGLIEPYSYRVLAEDCLDLPPLTYLPIVHVELTDEQRRHYQEMRHFCTTKLSSGDYVTSTVVIAQRTRLQQILCGFVVDESGVEHAISCNRPRALMEILGDHAGKAIVWFDFTRNLQEIRDLLKKEYGPESVACFWGGNRGTREAEEKHWKHDPACRFMLATPSAGGMGRNWTAASLMWFYSNGDDLEDRLQGEKRPHRNGLKHPVACGDFTTEGTIEPKKVRALRNKINLAATITGDKWREWVV